MIKNWTVTTQPVRLASDGVMMRERYLLNTEHANHKYTEDLVSLFGCGATSKRIALTGEQFRLNQQLNNLRGGRPLSTYAMEYCLTLPRAMSSSNPLSKIVHWLLLNCVNLTNLNFRNTDNKFELSCTSRNRKEKR